MSDLSGRAFGNYLIQEKIGEGGMGAVYVAQHKRFGRKVAVKTLHPHLSKNAEMVSRFFTEARSANEIRNQHIIEILDFDELEDGTCYIVMEWLEGRSLAQLLASEGRLELARALHIAEGICSALGAAHARKIVHRDLKPDNVFLEERNGDADFVKVLDFGIAKLLEEDEKGKKGFATKTGAIIGTPAYMAPEQCRGAHKEIDHRSDIYSTGAMVYQMVTGSRPFSGDGLGELLMAHLTQEPEPPSKHVPEIPPHVDKAILRALGKRREERFESMEDFAAALHGIEVPVGGTLVEPRSGKSGRYKIFPVGTATTTPSRPDAAPTVMGDGEVPAAPHRTATAAGAQPAGASQLKTDAGRSDSRVEPQNSTFSSVASELVSMDRRPRRRSNGALVVGGAALAIVGVAGGFALLSKPPPPAEPAPLVADPTPAPVPAPAGVAALDASPAAAAPLAAPAPTAQVASGAGAPGAADRPSAPTARNVPAAPAAPAGALQLPRLNLPAASNAEPIVAAAPVAAAPAAAAAVPAPVAAPQAPAGAEAPADPDPAAKVDRAAALDKALGGRQDALVRCVELRGPGLKTVSVEAMVTIDAAGSVKDVDVTARSGEGEVSDELRACLEKALKKGSYPKGSSIDVAEGKWTLSVE